MLKLLQRVVPYIGTWIETILNKKTERVLMVVPYIGTWIETPKKWSIGLSDIVVPYIGTWIETVSWWHCEKSLGRTLYRYVD